MIPKGAPLQHKFFIYYCIYEFMVYDDLSYFFFIIPLPGQNFCFYKRKINLKSKKEIYTITLLGDTHSCLLPIQQQMCLSGSCKNILTKKNPVLYFVSTTRNKLCLFCGQIRCTLIRSACLFSVILHCICQTALAITGQQTVCVRMLWIFRGLPAEISALM